MRLKDLAAIVTGGARGIGAGVAGCLVDEGARVALLDIDGEALLMRLERRHDQVCLCEELTPDQLERLEPATLEERYGSADMLKMRLPDDSDLLPLVNNVIVKNGSSTSITSIASSGVRWPRSCQRGRTVPVMNPSSAAAICSGRATRRLASPWTCHNMST